MRTVKIDREGEMSISLTMRVEYNAALLRMWIGGVL